MLSSCRRNYEQSQKIKYLHFIQHSNWEKYRGIKLLTIWMQFKERRTLIKQLNQNRILIRTRVQNRAENVSEVKSTR